MPRYSVDIIVVNWNAGAQLARALQPLIEHKNDDELAIRCYVVDNASTDDSLSMISQYPVEIIRNKTNLGFGKACNIAYARSGGDFLLLLNPDTEWKLPNLKQLLERLVAMSEFAAIGPQQLGENGRVMRTCGRFPRFTQALWDCIGLSKLLPSLITPAPLMTDWDHSNSQEVDHLMGSFVLFRRSALPKEQLFDERFFLYFEDLDLSNRLHRLGKKSYFDHHVKIMHAGGGTSRQVKAKRLFYSLQSREAYWEKYFSKRQYIILVCCAGSLELAGRLIQGLIHLNLDQCKETLSAYVLWYKWQWKRG
jgi:N-acetylglucosaminyl-diphospho-decaprenol L-rhamnosyltransferase